MAITKEFEAFLKDTLGVKIDVLKSALTSDDEVTVEHNQGTFLDDISLDALKESMKKTGYNDGKVAGVEIEAKRLKEQFGIEVEGKNLDKIFEAHGQKVLTDAKVEPNKKVEELQTSLNTLQQTYKTDLSAKNQEVNNLNSKLNQFSTNTRLMSDLPDNLSISPKHFLTLASSEFNFENAEDGSLLVKKGEVVLKDKLEKPLSHKDVLAQFAQDNGLIGKHKGRGNNDEGYKGVGENSDFKTINDVYRHMEKNKIDPTSKAGATLIEQFEENNG